MSVNESLQLDGLELNDLTSLYDLHECYALKELHMPPPAKRPEWATGGDADGGLLVRPSKYDNRQITGVLQITDTTRELVHARYGAVTDLIEEAERNPDGIPLEWTPANGTGSLTFWVLSGFLGEIEQNIDAGYFASEPILEVPFTFDCKPFGYGEEIGTIEDEFVTNTLADYSFDAGSGTVTISGGSLVPSDATVKQLYRTVHGFRPADLRATLKIQTGASVAGTLLHHVGKRLDSDNTIVLVHSTASNTLSVRKVDGGALSAALASVAYTLLANTSYWLRFRIAGNVVTASIWTSTPTLTGTPAAEVSYTLTGADATKYGVGVAGDAMMRLAPQATDWRYGSFGVEPNLARGTDPVLTIVIPGVPGDVPAEARLIVSEPDSVSRRYVEFGLQSRHTNLANALLIDSDSLVVSGFAGTSGALAGAYGGNAITATLTTNPVAVCGLGNLANVGTFRVKARVRPSSLGVLARLSWREGDGPLKSNPYAAVQQEDTFIELDLGIVNIPQAQLGTQRWTGQIEAYSDTVGDTLSVDDVILIPASEGYGKVRAEQLFETPLAFVARDEFDQSAGNLTGKTAPVGGVWAGAGAGVDFAVVAGSTHAVQRSTGADGANLPTSGRIATIGSSIASQSVQCDVSTSVEGGLAGEMGLCVVARYADVNNFVSLQLVFGGAGADALLRVAKTVAGAQATLRSISIPLPGAYSANPQTLRLIVDSGGRFFAWMYPQGSAAGEPDLSGSDSALATGGTLASGKQGIAGWDTLTGLAQEWDNIVASAVSDPAVLYAGRQLEIRHDGTIRQDSTGTYWGPPPSYRGSRCLVPPAGSEDRTTRVLVKAHRNDIEAMEDVPLADELQAQVVLTPRYLQVPR